MSGPLDLLYRPVLYEYEGTHPIVVNFNPGRYRFELWGAHGFAIKPMNQSGKGAYVKGIIELNRTTTFYLYIGEFGRGENNYSYSFNGGGMGQFGGGGATDVRYVGGDWDNFTSLKSRIIVAAGGGATDSSKIGGAGGALFGINGENGAEGGRQDRGGYGCANGTFGKGGGRNYTVIPWDGNGGGGSGYYGGGTDISCKDYGAGGGSSFISGYDGCDAINESSEEGNIIHTNQSYHYSGYFFRQGVMIPGNSAQLPSTDGGIQTDHDQINGAIKITKVGLYYVTNVSSKLHISLSVFAIGLLFKWILDNK